MSFITAVTHHLSSSHPPSFIFAPSHPHHSALLLSNRRSAPHHTVLPIKFPFSGVTVPFLLIALASFVPFFWLSHFLILESINLPPCPLLSSFIHPYPFLLTPLLPLPSLLSICCSGQFTYGSAFIPETQGILWTQRPD